MLSMLIGIVNLMHFKKFYKQEYENHRKSILGFLVIVVLSYVFRLANDIAILVTGKKYLSTFYLINCVIDYSGLKFTIIAFAFVVMKNSKEPLSQFQHIDFINLVGKS